MAAGLVHLSCTHIYVCACLVLCHCCLIAVHPSLSAKTRDGVKEAFEELVHKVGVAVS